MPKSIPGRVLFRKIAGRIIPIVSKGTDSSIRAARMSAKKTMSIKRKAIKNKIAARTSLAEKRIRAVRTIRKSKHEGILVSQNHPKAEIRFINDHVVKSGFRDYLGNVDKKRIRNIFRRFLHKNILSKRGKAPESFLVRTKKNAYIISERASKTLDESLGESLWSHEKYLRKSLKYERSMQEIEKSSRKLGISPYDIGLNNVGLYGKKAKVIDTDYFKLKEGRLGISLSERNRMRKFIIKKRRK